MKLSGVRLSVHQSHHAAAEAGLLLWARQPRDIGGLLLRRRSAANASCVTLADVVS